MTHKTVTWIMTSHLLSFEKDFVNRFELPIFKLKQILVSYLKSKQPGKYRSKWAFVFALPVPYFMLPINKTLHCLWLNTKVISNYHQTGTAIKLKNIFLLQYKCKLHSTIRYFLILFDIKFEAKIINRKDLDLKSNDKKRRR